VKPLPDSIRKLYETAEKWAAPIVGPRFYWDEMKSFRLPPAEGQSLFWKCADAAAQSNPVDEKLASYYWQIRFERFWQAKNAIYEPFLGGACLLVNSREFPRGRVFDPQFFLYYEETDFCFEAVKRDLKILCVPEAEMIHFWNMSPAPSTGKPKLMAESAELFMHKHYPDISIPSFSIQDHPVSQAVDLGSLDLPPGIDIPLLSDPMVYCEIGVNSFFIPFAQTDVSPGQSFLFPEEIWRRMESREYFLRIRGNISGSVKSWRFIRT
jgi:hypothetical protein